MDSNIKFVNNSIDSEDNPFVVKKVDKINEQLEVLQVTNVKKRRPKAVAAPGLILKEGEE